jgi:hypothetical protein
MEVNPIDRTLELFRRFYMLRPQPKNIATLGTDLPLFGTVDELLWEGPTMGVRLA